MHCQIMINRLPTPHRTVTTGHDYLPCLGNDAHAGSQVLREASRPSTASTCTASPLGKRMLVPGQPAMLVASSCSCKLAASALPSEASELSVIRDWTMALQQQPLVTGLERGPVTLRKERQQQNTPLMGLQTLMQQQIA